MLFHWYLLPIREARVLGTRDAKKLLELVQRCEKLPDIKQLLKATVPLGAQVTALPS